MAAPESDLVESWIVELLVLDEDTRPRRLLELCAANPRHSQMLRRRLALLNQAGLTEQGSREEFPATLGEFRLLRRIGGGGMGVVYAARQESLARDVALKVIRPEHLFFERARERFRREVEAVAKLQHPAIVPVYTVGEADGVPFFAMELVRGRSLADALRALHGRNPARLEGADLTQVVAEVHDAPVAPLYAGPWHEVVLRIVIAIAEGLVHAHERGVLHRDVKPSNVLLTAEGRVLLVDFGLAFADGAAPLTRSGAIVGSLPYMPPEQLRGTRHVDASADVYALGVTLYELLTLRSPFAADDDERLRARILAGDRDPIAVHNRRVPGDVQLVCMAAIDQDPRRRYPTMRAFLSDLEHLLARRPIAARRSGLLLRTKRWAERNRVAATVMLAVVLGCIAFSTQQWALRARIERQRQLAETEATTSRRVTEFLIGLFELGDPAHSYGGKITMREVLARAASRAQAELADEPRVRGALLHALGSVHWSMGLVAEAEPLLARALETRRAHGTPREVAQTLLASARLLATQGKLQLAEARLAEARALVPAGGGDDPLDLTLRETVGQVLRDRGDLEGAAKVLGEVLAERRRGGRRDSQLLLSLVSYGDLAKERGETEAARSLLLEAQQLCTELHEQPHPDELAVLWTLGALYVEQGQLTEADALLNRALVLLRRLYDQDAYNLGTALDRLAALAVTRGDVGLAEQHYREALAALERVGATEHPQFLDLLNHYGVMLTQEGRCAEAEALLRKALATRERTGQLEQPALAYDQVALAQLLTVAGPRDEAGKLFRKAMPVLKEKLGDSVGYASCLQVHSLWRAATGDLSGAEQGLRKALEIRRRRSRADDPELAKVLDSLGYVLTALGRAPEADELLARSLGILRRALPADHVVVLRTALHRADALKASGRLDAAEQLLLESLAGRGTATAKDAESEDARRLREKLVEVYEAAGKPEKAVAYRR